MLPPTTAASPHSGGRRSPHLHQQRRLVLGGSRGPTTVGPLYTSSTSSRLRLYVGLGLMVTFGLYLMSGGGGSGGSTVDLDSASRNLGLKVLSPEEYAKAANEAFTAASVEFDAYLTRMERVERDEARSAEERIVEGRATEARRREREERHIAQEKRKKAEQEAAVARQKAAEARAAEEQARKIAQEAKKAAEEAVRLQRAAEEEERKAEAVSRDAKRMEHDFEALEEEKKKREKEQGWGGAEIAAVGKGGAMKEANDAHDRRGQRDQAEKWLAGQEAKEHDLEAAAKRNLEITPKKPTYGFVVLGMHRSGTSMLSGLLVTGMGYKVGSPLIGPAFDNTRGFFERIDVVLQNDEFMKVQGGSWASNAIGYDPNKALEDLHSKRVAFKEGEKGLKFLNDKSNAPWLQKDPRMCITLETWLELLNNEPAVVFTYRHPVEVANSLKKRESFPLERGLRLWIVYNMRAVQNSAGLCRVLSSNEALLADPKREVQRISDELTKRCGVPAPSMELTQASVDKFVDPTLNHNQKAPNNQIDRALAKHGDCVVPEYESDYEEGTPERSREKGLYLIAMKIYCDFRSGDAYKQGYQWPTLPP